MSVTATYQFVNKLQSQYREPAWSWGFRVAVSVVAPLLWGFFTNRALDAEWMAIAAECISFIELKGNAGQRVRLLTGAALLSIIFCILGSLAGVYAWISILGMLVVGFLCGLFKNLGDRGLGLALSVYIFYIITSSYPTTTAEALLERCQWVLIGALWTIATGLFGFLFLKVGTPYRKTIAAIWKTVSGLAATSGKGWDGRSAKSSVREIFLKEKEVRTAINDSIYLFEETSDEVTNKQKNKYAMVQSRKSASLVSLYIIQISETAAILSRQKLGRQFEVQVFSLFRALQQIGERLEVYLLTLKEEEKVLVTSRLERLNRIAKMLQDAPEAASPEVLSAIQKINLLSGRIIKLVNHSLRLLEQLAEPRVYHAYSFAQTISILHPKYLRTNIRQLFNFNSFTTRYALRIGISTMIAMLLARLFFPNHGYWIPYTTIIVAQPYFGATLKKGIDRSLGTLAGILAGSLFLQLPFPAIARIVLVFVSSVFLIYFLRRKYAVAAFFITLTLVGLLGMEPHFDSHLLEIRLVSTLIGSALAILAGFLLLPNWDKSNLPRFIAEAFMANIDYFQNTFYYNKNTHWTRLKRNSETRNSNAFDSLTRSLQEPGIKKAKNTTFYFLLMHNIRITRELNNFNSESEADEEKIPVHDKEKYIQLLYECDDLFRNIVGQMKQAGNPYFDEKYLKTFPDEGLASATPTDAQLVYVEKLLIELKLIKGLLQKPVSEKE